MKSKKAPPPPLHRRFDEQKAINLIRNRYENFKRLLDKQVKELRHYEPFRHKCRSYYDKGYKDWLILSIIYGCMINWRALEMGLNLFQVEDLKKLEKVHNSLGEFVYEPERFLREDFEFQLHIQLMTQLRSYGFEIRRRAIDPEILEQFLRIRMRHFDYDLPHRPLFGEHPGEWPNADCQ
jgi:hypothetical protein